MTISRTVPVLGLLIGFAALMRGLLLLDRDPLVAVLGLLAAMAVLLASVALLCGDAQVRPIRQMEDTPDFEP